MTNRSVALVLGFMGGLLILLGGLLRLLGELPQAVSAPMAMRLLSTLSFVLATVVLGVIVLWVCRPRVWWWPGRRLLNGILLVVMGAVTWLLLGGELLTVLGAVLAVLAGLLLPLEGLVSGGWRPRRSLARRLV